MQLLPQATFEELLGAVDMLCIPSSKEMMDNLYKDVLSIVIPADTLPSPAELCGQKSSGILLYGKWKDKKIKILIYADHDKLTEATAYSVTKKLSIRAKSEQVEKTGLMVHHLSSPELIKSALTGWTAGLYDLGIYKNTEENSLNHSGSSLFTFLPDGMNPSTALEGITIGLVQREVMDLVNTPANHQSPALLGEWAMQSASAYGYLATILDK
ncbi:MAG: hypothetical protein ABIQ02_05905, partial [Saprospiraceae bacterium]